MINRTFHGCYEASINLFAVRVVMKNVIETKQKSEGCHVLKPS